MGTAGPIGLAKDYLLEDNTEGLFFVINSDVVAQYDLESLLKFHKKHGKEATVNVKGVEDPAKHGVVVSNDSGLVSEYVDKPDEFISNKVNAGIYCFNTSVIDKVPCRPSSLENDLLPRLAQDGNLYCIEIEGYWMDIGLPHNYLLGVQLHL